MNAIATIRMPNAPRPCKVRFVRGKIRARIEAQLREYLAPWGLPLHRYRCTVTRASIGEGPYTASGQIFYRDDIPLSATFIHRRTGAHIAITQIWIDDDGEILQMGSQYGELTL